jgi:hypothetical protein
LRAWVGTCVFNLLVFSFTLRDPGNQLASHGITEAIAALTECIERNPHLEWELLDQLANAYAWQGILQRESQQVLKMTD